MNNKLKIGIPRVLNMYENFPFWKTLFEQCGMDVILSSESTVSLYRSGIGSVMSDNIRKNNPDNENDFVKNIVLSN
jgi:predicted nucleotide-binding protein (sugar kinase/HSP70/actin superfamily)